MSHDTTLKRHENSIPGRSPDKHDDEGGELGDPTPMEPPLGYKRSLSLSEQIAQQVRLQHLRILEDSAVHETEDDADDFEVGDDYEPLSKYENEHMPTLANLKKKAKEIQDQIEKRNLELKIKQHKEASERYQKRTSPQEPTPEADTLVETKPD